MRKWHLEYHPNHIWNVDECGVPDVPTEQVVLARKGQRAFQTVAGEKAVNTTVVCFVSAGGLACPPLLILKGSRVDQKWREATPSGYMVRASPSGYISQELFAQYGERFIEFLEENHLLIKDRTSKMKNLLLLDLHKSHLFNLNFMNLMREHNVEVCSFPPHCTHLLQPLNNVPFARFKKHYNQALLDLNFTLAGRKMTRNQFFRLFVPAFTSSMVPDMIKKGVQEHWHLPN